MFLTTHSTLHNYSSSENVNLATICSSNSDWYTTARRPPPRPRAKQDTAGQANLEPGSNCSQHNASTQRQYTKRKWAQRSTSIWTEVLFFPLYKCHCVSSIRYRPTIRVQFKNSHANASGDQRWTWSERLNRRDLSVQVFYQSWWLWS